MKRVKGFSRARKSLARESVFETLITPARLRAQIRQVFGEELSVQEVVERVIGEVRSKGDKALFDYTRKLDGVQLDSFEVGRQEILAAYDMTDKEVVSALKFAARRIRDFHVAGGSKAGLITVSRHLKQQILPLQRVGLYVPGGTAAYPSTVLMMAIPAKVAGVEQIIMVSPPGKDGRIPASTLVAADIAKVNRIFKLGGAQAIAALAYGTQSIPKVDKICGPGNIFVTLAKKVVFGTVDIDGLEGPSEIVIVADEKADPSLCAADLLAQAEHDPLASVILITISAELADNVEEELLMPECLCLSMIWRRPWNWPTSLLLSTCPLWQPTLRLWRAESVMPAVFSLARTHLSFWAITLPVPAMSCPRGGVLVLVLLWVLPTSSKSAISSRWTSVPCGN